MAKQFTLCPIGDLLGPLPASVYPFVVEVISIRTGATLLGFEVPVPVAALALPVLYEPLRVRIKWGDGTEVVWDPVSEP